MRIRAAAASGLLLSAVAGAQSHIVLPAEAAQRPGNTTVIEVFFGSKSYPPQIKNESRAQMLYDLAQIPVAKGMLKSLSLRIPADSTVWSASRTVNLDIWISNSPVVHDQASRTFAQNHGGNKTRVYQGSYSLPAKTKTPWPQPWLAPIVFQTPFAFDRSQGRSLVIEIQTSGSTVTGPWSVEAYGIDRGEGTGEFIDTRCRNSAGSATNGFGYNPDFHVGGQFYLDIATYPNGTPSLATNALFFGLKSVGSPWGSHTLPVELNLLGLVSKPFCNLAVVPLFSLAMTPWDPVGVPGTQPATHLRLQPFKIPNDPLLVNRVFYTQNIALDTDRNTGKTFLFPTMAIRWRIGSGDTIAGSLVVSKYDNSAPTGLIGKGVVASMRLGY